MSSCAATFAPTGARHRASGAAPQSRRGARAEAMTPPAAQRQAPRQVARPLVLAPTSRVMLRSPRPIGRGASCSRPSHCPPKRPRPIRPPTGTRLRVVSAYARNHLSSRFYLDGFAGAGGSVKVVTMGGHRPVRLAKPANVAYRRNFWGRDPTLRQEVEQKLSEVESDARRFCATLCVIGRHPIRLRSARQCCSSLRSISPRWVA